MNSRLPCASSDPGTSTHAAGPDLSSDTFDARSIAASADASYSPVDTIGIPRLPRKAENKVYTHAEVDAIAKHFFGREGMREYALLFRLLKLTAMRIGEA
jgi:hypothetical protein